MKKRYVILITIILLIALSFFAYNYLNKKYIIDNRTIGIYLEDEYDSNTFHLSDNREIPSSGYHFNVDKTNEMCDGATFIYENNSISTSIDKGIKCNLYFNKNLTLPEGYKQIEYIYIGSNQYINTGISASKPYNYKIGISFDGYQATAFIGAYAKMTQGASYRNWIGIYNGNLHIIAKNYWQTSSPTLSLNTKYDFEINTIDDNKTAKVNGEDMSISKLEESTFYYPNLQIYLGAYNFDNSINYSLPTNEPYSGRVYYLEIYDENNNAVTKMYAAKKTSNNTVGMYDIVRNEFFSGSFTAGPEI